MPKVLSLSIFNHEWLHLRALWQLQTQCNLGSVRKVGYWFRMQNMRDMGIWLFLGNCCRS